MFRIGGRRASGTGPAMTGCRLDLWLAVRLPRGWCVSIAGVPSRVLIVDDHEGFRAAAHALLEAEGFVVVGEAGDGPGAVEAVGRLRPDVVLLDVQLPGIDGFGVAELLAPRVVTARSWC